MNDADDAQRMCPPLVTERGMLVPLRATHAAELFSLLCDADVWRYTGESAPADLAALTARYRRWESRRSPDGSQWWLNWVFVLADDRIVGFVQATVDARCSEADIAYVVGRRFWSQGYGTKATRAMTAFLREALGVSDLRATVDERNVASLRLLERVGFAVVDRSDPANVLLAFHAPR